MQIERIFEILEEKNVKIWVEDEKLRYKAPAKAISNEILDVLKTNKKELIEYLKNENIEVQEDLDARFLPFPLTDVQSAYLLGRTDVFDYGGVACHVYMEIKYDEIDHVKAQKVWNQLIKKHEMLRAIVKADGYQQILKNTPEFVIRYNDIQENMDSDITISNLRNEMSHRIYNTEQWPLFDIALTKTKYEDILHLSIDFLIADWTSIWMLILEFEQIYFNGKSMNKIPGVSYRDYVIAERKKLKTQSYVKAKSYWLKRIDDFPLAPQLPRNNLKGQQIEKQFMRKSLHLQPEKWKVFKEKSMKKGITPTILLLCAYATCLERWSENKRFALNLTVLNRLPVHKDINNVIGDFTSINLLEIDMNKKQTFGEFVDDVNKQLFDDLDHNLFSGVEVIREIQRKHGTEDALMPFVFTSAIGLTGEQNQKMIGKYEGNGISQTPQVFIDCQAMDGDFGMIINWDYRKGVFQEEMISDMFSAFEALLLSIIDDFNIWDKELIVELPENQFNLLRSVNETHKNIPPQLLHEQIICYARNNPKKVAVIDSKMKLTYGELISKAGAVKDELKKYGCKPGDKIAIVMEKSALQVVAVLGVLSMGAVYVAIDGSQADDRRNLIIRNLESEIVLTHSDEQIEFPDGIQTINVDLLSAVEKELECEPVSPDEIAYIIYTSGSTGIPKGVIITHKAAWNTIADINQRFGVSEKDVAIGLSELTFDLAVYDIFGLLSVGGSLVYPEKSRKKDPSYWAELVDKYSITIWNSVPAFARMLVAYLQSEKNKYMKSLRLTLLSGDWIPLEVPDLLIRYCPNLRVISLGGATEASIWSIFYEYERLREEWVSIPYGKPLANQGFRILDNKMNDCPIWVPGDIYITGAGLAVGYYNDKMQTDSVFVIHPREKIRMYRTGDIGRYLPDGNIEFLGRKDNQIKINGHRIEIGEINENLKKLQGVKNAVTIAHKEKHDVTLFSFIEPDDVDVQNNDTREDFNLMFRDIDAQSKLMINATNVNRLEKIEVLLNEVMQISIMKTLKEFGTFEGRDTGTEACYVKTNISQKYYWLIQNWFNLLVKTEKIKVVDGNVVYEDSLFESLDNKWEELEKIWDNDFGYMEFFAYIKQCAEKLRELLENKVDPVKLLYPDGKDLVVKSMYTQNIMSRYLNMCIKEAVKAIIENSNSEIRILEIGAGTGATSEQLLSSFKGKKIEYTFTDKAAFFIANAKKRLNEYDNVYFKILDIDQDYRMQGFSPNTYNIIIAVGVLENAREIEKSLKLVRELSAPNGYFLFTEPVEEEAWILGSQAFMMTKPEDEIRKEHALISESQWIQLLHEVDEVDTSILVFPKADEPLASLNIRLFIKQFKINKFCVSTKQLQEQLTPKLPDYMIPNYIQVIDEWPLTANGKLNLKMLEQWRITENNRKKDENEEIIRGLTEFEQSVAKIWEDFGIILHTPMDNFYSNGADSLIMAQVAGKIREKLVPDIAFDSILREILNYPTLSELCSFLKRKMQNMETEEKATGEIFSKVVEEENQESNGVYSEYGVDNGKTIRIVFHAALGTLNCFRMLIPHLVEQKQGKVIGISIKDPQKYYELKYEETVQRLADDYAEQLAKYDYEEFQLIGYCYAGWIALGVGARLLEKGVNVKEVVLVDSQLVPFKIEDDLIIEALYIPNIYVSLEDIGIDSFDFSRAIKQILDQYGNIPKNSSIKVAGDEGLSKISARFEELSKMTLRERFTLYTYLSKKNTGNEMHIEMAEVLFKTYLHTFKSTHFEAQPFVGNVRYLIAKEPISEFYDRDSTIDYWADLCLGDFLVEEIDGNHYTCIETEPNAQKLADIIGAVY